MGKPNSFTRLVLYTRAPKQFKNALKVTLCDASAIVGNLNGDLTWPRESLNSDLQRSIRDAELDGIVQQVPDDLFQGKLVRENGGDFKVEFDLSLGFSELMLVGS
jgi:hypothetical protein